MIRFKKIIVRVIPILVSFFCSCTDNEVFTPVDIQNINSVLATSAFVSENIEIAANVIDGMPDSLYTKGIGTQITVPSAAVDSVDNRVTPATVNILTETSTSAPQGTITIIYDTLSQADAMGVSRSGQIVIKYYGKKWATSSYFSLHYKNFVRGNVKMSGVDSLIVQAGTSSSRLPMTSYSSNDTIFFPDGENVTLQDTLARVWYRQTIRLNDQWQVSGNTIGNNKKGYSYVTTTTSTLVSLFSCRASKVFVPVGGKETITYKSGKSYQIDFGNSITCDNQVNVTVGKAANTLIVYGDGN